MTLPGGAAAPWSTSALPGLGGHIGPEPEDFRVVEIPASTPSGEGHHFYVQIEKRGLSTGVVRDALARAAKVKRLGKHLAAAPLPAVLLPEEVPGRLRQLRADSRTVADRFRSMQLRNLIEPRVRARTQRPGFLQRRKTASIQARAFIE